MKRHLLLVPLLGFYLLSGGYPARAASKPADFSGKWTLDREQTSNLPLQLDSYSMVVSQDSAQLKVESKVEMKDNDDMRGGDNPAGPDNGSYPGGSGGGYPGRTGVGFPGRGGIGFPGGGGYPQGGGHPRGGGPRSSSSGQRGLRALRTYLPTVTYFLNGAETTTEVKGRMPGKATLKAIWKKGGKVLDLSTVQNLDAGDNSTVTVKSKEKWEFSKDGKYLKMERTVNTSRGSDTIKLAFRKGEAPADSQ